MNQEISSVASEIMKQLERAWNAADGAAFGAPFADDADFVDIRSDLHHGRPAIAAGHQALFDSIYRGSTVSMELLAVRPLGGDLALAHVRSTLTAPAGPLAGTNHSTFSMVLRRASRWEVAAFQNTLAPPRH
jgi:uncharacterized protein (TIGR02246 family)